MKSSKQVAENSQGGGEEPGCFEIVREPGKYLAGFDTSEESNENAAGGDDVPDDPYGWGGRTRAERRALRERRRLAIIADLERRGFDDDGHTLEAQEPPEEGRSEAHLEAVQLVGKGKGGMSIEAFMEARQARHRRRRGRGRKRYASPERRPESRSRSRHRSPSRRGHEQ